VKIRLSSLSNVLYELMPFKKNELASSEIGI
jgi:hypothetical protein